MLDEFKPVAEARVLQKWCGRTKALLSHTDNWKAYTNRNSSLPEPRLDFRRSSRCDNGVSRSHAEVAMSIAGWPHFLGLLRPSTRSPESI